MYRKNLNICFVLGILPDALKTNCIKCTEKQKTVTLRTVKRLKKEYPKIWAQLQEQWDPEDKYVKLFEATYGDRWKEPLLQPTIQINNRFGEEDSSNDIKSPPTRIPQKTTVELEPVNKISPNVNSIFTTDSYTVEKNKNSEKFTTTVKTLLIMTNSVTPPSSHATQSTKKKIIVSDKSTPISPSTTNKFTSLPAPTTTTTKPFITTRFTPIRLPSVSNIGASIQATVSLGTNVVGDILRGLGALGTRVAETGVDIAEVVVKNFSRPLL